MTNPLRFELYLMELKQIKDITKRCNFKSFELYLMELKHC